MSTTYNGNDANVAASTSVQITIPQDGDPFTASEDNARTNTLADWAELFYKFLKGGTAVPTGFNVTPPSYSTLTGSTGWTFTGGSNFVKYWKDALGLVHLKAFGQFATGGSDPVFTAALPVGYRPLATLPFFAMRVPSGGAIAAGAGAFAVMAVDGAGQIYGANSMTNGDNLWINGTWQGEQ